MKKVLITGFEKFDDARSNPTEDMLQGLQCSEIMLRTAVLPVTFDGSFLMLQKLIADFSPDYILLCGLAGNREQISLEKVAINYVNARIADNTGKQPLNVKISKSGADGYFSTFPIAELVAYLQDKSVQATVSLSAGSYVCNYLMYQALHALQNSGIQTTFVHFPPLTKTTSIKAYQQFLSDTLNFITHRPNATAADLEKSAKLFAVEN
ncbi:MAG: pyroglutamyl-peptidase [Oceanospirillaceae bacterium]|jgi:pyroglutamyl-peptidase